MRPQGQYGIRSADLEGAPSLIEVLSSLRGLLRGCLVVGHGVRKDLLLLGISHPNQSIRNTSELPKFLQPGRPRKLKGLAREFFSRRIQNGEHDQAEDACACMSLYLGHWNLPGMAPRLTPVTRFPCHDNSNHDIDNGRDDDER